jgi:hypothetical protein
MTTTCCINTTNTRQNKLCNSKNKMEQFARYLLHNTEHCMAYQHRQQTGLVFFREKCYTRSMLNGGSRFHRHRL